MSEDQNLQTVQRVYQAFAAGDIPAMSKLCTDDVDVLIPGSARVLTAGHWHGRDGLNQCVGNLLERLEFQVFQPDEFIVGKDSVAVLGHERCRVRASGRVVEAKWVQVWTLRDGMISRYREYTDTAAWEAGYPG
jgi:uncharacterized protein